MVTDDGLWPGRSELQQLCPGVWITNFFGSRDLAKLSRHGITHVCVCAQELPRLFEAKGLVYLQFPLADNPGQNIQQHFAAAFQFIEQAISNEQGQCLLHCAGGGSRSAAIALGYLLHCGHSHTLVRHSDDSNVEPEVQAF